MSGIEIKDKLEEISTKIIIKNAKVQDEWFAYLNRNRCFPEYPKIEKDVDNWLRGYNEAVDDALAVLDEVGDE